MTSPAPSRVLDRKPTAGHVFLIKYSFDNVTWSSFYSMRAQESGNIMKFFECRVKINFTNSHTGTSEPYAGSILDIKLDATKARTFGYLEKIPFWYGRTEDDASALCAKGDGLDLLADPYNGLALPN